MSEDDTPLNDLLKAEIDADETLSLDGDEFLSMMEERGLIIPRGPTLLQRAWSVATYPFRALGRGVSYLVWHMGGKVVHRRRVEKQIRRMQQLAGVGPYAGPDPRDNIEFYRPEKVGYVGYTARAAEHEHIIKTKIVREELPKPDFDDGAKLN